MPHKHSLGFHHAHEYHFSEYHFEETHLTADITDV